MSSTHEADTNRIPKLAITGILFLLLLIAGLGLKPGGSPTMLQNALQMTGHFGCFGVLAFLVAVASPYLFPWLQNRRWGQYLCGLTVSIGVGGLLEFGQLFIPGRYANLGDFLSDVSGAVAAICLLIAIHQIGRPGLSYRALQVTCGLAFCLLTISGVRPFVVCYINYYQRDAAFPQLIDFRQDWSNKFANLAYGARLNPRPLPPGWKGSDNAIGVRFPSQHRYPGFAVKEPYPDWRRFETFAFDVFAPHQAFLEFRVNDIEHNNDYHDRFNRRLNLKQGFQTIRIPIEQIRTGPKLRELDLSKIENFMLFVLNPKNAQDKPPTHLDLWVGNFRLE